MVQYQFRSNESNPSSDVTDRSQPFFFLFFLFRRRKTKKKNDTSNRKRKETTMVLLVKLQISVVYALFLFIFMFTSSHSFSVGSALQMTKNTGNNNQQQTNLIDGALVLQVQGSGVELVNQSYKWQDASVIPPGFAKVCLANQWNVEATWKHLNRNQFWLRGTINEAYIYFNSAVGHWWIDEPNGTGVFIARPLASNNHDQNRPLPPTDGWKALSANYNPLPTILTL